MTLLASLAHLDVLDPFGLQDLVGSESAMWVRIENRVDDIAALSL
jgi:hypothetical protein